MSKDLHEDLKLFNSLVDELLKQEQEAPVSKSIKTEELQKKIDISLSDNPAIRDEFIKTLKKLILYTPKTAANRFFNQLWGGRNSKAVLGDLLAVMLNISMATYKVAGPQIEIEKEIIKQVCKIVGYGKNGNGTFPTGGSMSNFMALVMARDKINLDIREKGISQKLVAYASENTHYSIAKNASFTGIGKENVRYIKPNTKGQMNLEELEKAVEKDIFEGYLPFFVMATAGTTVLCAFDDVLGLSSICKKHNIWLHLDGAFGGSVIFSDKYKYLINGVAKTDSFCFNAHKTLGTPLSSSVMVVKEKKDLHNSFSYHAPYLYQTDNDDYNLGLTSFECGRRNNALKFWTLWKSVGKKGLGKIINHEFSLADTAREYVRNNPGYTLYSYDDSLAICFNYKNFDAVNLCTKIYQENKLMVGHGSFNGDTFIRLVIVNAGNSKEDILKFFKILEKFVLENKEDIKKV